MLINGKSVTAEKEPSAAAAWRDVARATLVVRGEVDPLMAAVMRRDPHQLRAVADALAQAVQALVANAAVLSEEAP